MKCLYDLIDLVGEIGGGGGGGKLYVFIYSKFFLFLVFYGLLNYI